MAWWLGARWFGGLPGFPIYPVHVAPNWVDQRPFTWDDHVNHKKDDFHH